MCRPDGPRAVTLFEAVLPRARTVLVMELSLKEWNEGYDFFVKIPAARGQQIDDLAAYTHKMIPSGDASSRSPGEVTALNVT